MIRRNNITVVFLVLTSIWAQSIFGQNLSTEGNDFWVSFMNNWLQNPDNPVILEIFISAKDTTESHIEMPLEKDNFSPVDTVILPGEILKIGIPTDLGMAQGTNQYKNNGIHITTDKDVSVYAMNKRQYSADVAVILPSYTLGNEYMVISHWEEGNRNNNDNSDSEFLILGIENDTRIQITPSHITEGGDQAGIPFQITLDKGQSYQVQARGDLTGTRIEAVPNTDSECKKFAVFAGNQYTKVGECDNPNGHDHLFAQMYPVYTWGKEYITVDFNSRTGGDHVKVIAAEDSSEIYLNGEFVSFLDRGEFLFLKELDGVNTITSQKPISVAQFSRSQACDNTTGDPFIILINPNQQVLKSISFLTPTIATIQNYNLSIVTKTTDVPTVKHNGSDISHAFETVPANPEYSYAKLLISQGSHTLESNEGLIAYVYGYGNNESFGYPTGAGLSNLNLKILVEDDSGPLPMDSICHKTEIWFRVDTEYEFSEFQWDMGDGNTITTSGPDPVSYVYDRPGKYIVKLKATTGSFGCLSGAEQESVQVVRVYKPEASILGPRSVCPNSVDVEYKIKANESYNYQWFSYGGKIASLSNIDTISIDWMETNPEAWLKVVPWDDRGCYGDTIVKPVKIKIELEPEAPFGPDSLCADNRKNIQYNTYRTEGSTYQWFLTNGTVQSGHGGPDVVIDWEYAGSEKIWFRQESVTDTVCAGNSDTLAVYIQRDPSASAEIITDKYTYGINEPVQISLVADSLYQLVNWQFDENRKLDSVTLAYSPEITYNCPGIYTIQALTLDTVGLCDAFSHPLHEIEILGPEPEIVQVSHENSVEDQLLLRFLNSRNQFYDKPYYLVKNLEIFDTLEILGPQYLDTLVISDSLIYTYEIKTNLDCDLPIRTTEHSSILLMADIDDPGKQEADITWSDYSGWHNGVEEYELWMKVDGGAFEMFYEGNETAVKLENENRGFSHCFKVKANELNGKHAYSWSNDDCITFIPELYPYNIITPNEDGLNEHFIIENIEHYPNSVLTIFNRWGKKLFQKRGYQNNWHGMAGGEILPGSTYFYVLELNEPRSDIRTINGMISILK